MPSSVGAHGEVPVDDGPAGADNFSDVGGFQALRSWARLTLPCSAVIAAHLRDTGLTMTEIVAKSGIIRSRPYRYLSPRPVDQLTAGLDEVGVEREG